MFYEEASSGRSTLKKPVRLTDVNGSERKCMNASMQFLDAEVERLLVSVSAIVVEGHRVVFRLWEVAHGSEDPDLSKEQRFCLTFGRETEHEAVEAVTGATESEPFWRLHEAW